MQVQRGGGGGGGDFVCYKQDGRQEGRLWTPGCSDAQFNTKNFRPC